MHYPAKILLFGEHTVLHDGRALAVPFTRFGVQWVLKPGQPDERLLSLRNYLQREFSETDFAFQRLTADLESGWQLLGNVPGGYGVGSSGTVCAAIFDRYGPSGKPMDDCKSILARMEGFYHGQSSGTDPLISLLQQPLLLCPEGVQTIELHPDWSEGLFLLDTGIKREAGPLIDRFTRQFATDAAWRIRVQSDWMTACDLCLDSLLNHREYSLSNPFHALSEQQFTLVPWLIPDRVRSIWRGESYRLKLCGAGGGGFMLGLSQDWKRTQTELAGYHLYKV